jgi:hypothetical protein
MPRKGRRPVDWSADVSEWRPEGWDDPWAEREQVQWPDPTGDLEVDQAGEVAAVKSAFQVRAETEKKRRAAATDGQYYACVVFASKAEVDAFMSRLGLPPDARYILGRTLVAELDKKG